MKTIAYILLPSLLLFCHDVTEAHQVALNTESPVMLYNDAYGANINYVIVQKFDEDLCAFVDILEDGIFRFKVNVSIVSSEMELQQITGWLDKVNCVVFLRPDTYENGDAILHIHSAPDANSDYTSVKIHVGSGVGYVVHYKDDWYCVVTEVDGKLYQGWIKRYCPNIYNSCT